MIRPPRPRNRHTPRPFLGFGELGSLGPFGSWDVLGFADLGFGIYLLPFTLILSTTWVPPSVFRAIASACFRAAGVATVPCSVTTPSFALTSIDSLRTWRSEKNFDWMRVATESSPFAVAVSGTAPEAADAGAA